MSKRSYTVFGQQVPEIFGSGMGKRRRTGAIGANARFKRVLAGAASGLQRRPMYRTNGYTRLKKIVANAKETGFVDVAFAAYNADTTGSIALLNTVAQGASVNQRVGKKIMLKSLQCHGYMQANTTATVNDFSVLVVYDKRPVGALPAITDILNSANANSFNNDANSGRFRILKRWDDVLVGNSATPSTGQEVKEADFYLNLRDLPTTFKAAGTGAIGDQEEGSLLLVTVGLAAAGTTAATLAAGFRLRFIDC